jgi:deazaflavin-dependent oxidoreductase (nitroreductase family)
MDALTASGLLTYPVGWRRWLMHTPVLLYRMGLGKLLELFHFMIITTRGRRSGVPRHTTIEYRRHGKRYYAISAWGGRADWYQNLLTDPHVTLRRGSKTFAAKATLVDNNAEALLVLHLFRSPNPLVYDAILARLGNAQSFEPRTMPEISGQYTIVRFDPLEGYPPLPTLEDDLRWVPLVCAAFGAGAALALTFGRRKGRA